MAKKKNKQFELDEYGLESDLDIPDFNFDPVEVKDDRKPATKMATAALEGAKDTIVNPAIVRKLIREALPRGYGQALDLADSSAGSLRGLYNDTAKEIKPALKELKRTTARLLPIAEPVLPKKLSETIKNWTKQLDPERQKELDAAQQREAGLGMMMAEVFKAQQQENVRESTKADVKDQLREGTEQKRHRDQLEQLDDMRRSLAQLAGYQSKVESTYQRKSLELQYRHYFVAQDQLEEQKRMGAIFQSNLEGILKNTGLPEYAKLKNTERFGEAMRNDFVNGISDSVFAKRRDMIKNLSDKFVSKAKEKVSSTLEGVRMALGAADSMLDLQEMQREMGVDGQQMAGNMAGGMVADNLVTRAAAKIRKATQKHVATAKLGNQLSYGVENAPQLLSELAKGTKGDDLPFGIGSIIRFGKDVINSSNTTKTSLTTDSAANMLNPDIFTRQTNKSITDIIPMYLSKIHQEVAMIRTGDDTLEPLLFDHLTGKFNVRSGVKKKILSSLVNKTDRDWTKRYSKELIDKLDANGKLSEEEKKVLAKTLTEANMNNAVANPKHLMDADSEMYAGVTREHADKFSEVFKDHFRDDATHEKRVVFSRDFSRLGDGTRDVRKEIQDLVNLGHTDLLQELGIVREDGKTIDMAKLRQYQMYDEDDPALTASGGSGTPPSIPPNAPGGPTPPLPPSPLGGPGNAPLGPNNPQVAPMGPPPPPPAIPPYAGPANPPMPSPALGGQQVEALFNNLGTTIIDAVDRNSVVTQATAIEALLTRMADRLDQGVTTFGGGPGDPNAPPGTPGAGGGPWYNRSLKHLAGGALSAGQSMFNMGTKLGKKMFNASASTASFAWNKAGQAFNWAKKKKDEVFDLYVGDETKARLLKWKLEAGHYIDKTTGNVITKLSDITGDVIDKFDPDKVVLKFEEIRDLVQRNGMVKKAVGALTSLPSKFLKAVKWGGQQLPVMYNAAFKLAGKAYSLLDGPQDVFVKGKSVPALLKVTMKAGGYISKLTGKPINKPGDIDGPVICVSGDKPFEALSQEDLDNGLLDSEGEPLKSNLKKLFGLGMKGLKFAKDQGKKAFNFVRDAAKSTINKVKGAFSGFNMGETSILSGNSVGGGMGGSKTNRLLMQIRDMLNVRLPGDHINFPEEKGGELGSKVKAGISGAVGMSVRAAKAHADKLREKLNEQGGAKGIFGKAKDKASGLLGKLWKRDGIAVSGMDKLLKAFNSMKDSLSAGKKKIFGDSDGDGVRDGSWIDRLRNRKGRKDAAAQGTDGARFTGGKSLTGTIMDGARGLYDKYRDYRDGAAAVGAAGGGGGAAGGGAGGAGAPAGPPGAPGGANPQSRMGRFGQAARRGLGAVASNAGKVAGVGGAALGAYGAYENVKEGNYGMAAVDAGLGLGSLALSGVGLSSITGAGAAIGGGLATGAAALGGMATGAMGVLGTAAAGIGAVLSAPVVLGALAVAAVGAGAYYGYKYLTKKKLDNFSKIRYVQYGFLPEDDKKIGQVLGLEDLLMPGITFKEGKPELDDKKVNQKKLMDSFGVDLKDETMVKRWAIWFAQRFKPVFFTHLTALQSLNPKASLNNVAKDLDEEDQGKFFTMIRYPDGPYYIDVCPFPGEKSLKAGSSEVQTVYDMVKVDMEKQKKEGDKKSSGADAVKKAAVATAAVGAAAALGKEGKEAPSTGEQEAANFSALIKDLENPTPVSLADSASSTYVGAVIPGSKFRGGRVDAMACIRFKSYGLVEMDGGKVNALSALEDAVGKGITLGKDDTAQWQGSATDIINTHGPAFGIEGVRNTNAYAWMSWFNTRFLPVITNYATALLKATGKKNIASAEMMLNDRSAVDVGMAVYTSKSKANGSNVSVWEISTSPWPGYELNSDIKSVEKNMEELKQKAKNIVLDEAVGTNAENKTKTKDTKEAEKATSSNDPNKMGVNDATKSEGFFSKAGSKLTDAWKSTKDFFGGEKKEEPKPAGSAAPANPLGNAGAPLGGGGSGGGSGGSSGPARAVGEMGAGTGGMKDSLPNPTGNRSWAGLKDLIMAAAKMAGVDDKLMASIAAIESGFDYTVKAGTSSATGLYQFISRTWKTMLKKYGSKYGISPDTPPTDPKANALMGAEFLKENANAIKGAVKDRKLTDTDLYLAHFLGASGAKKFLSADPNAIAADIMPEAARANKDIFYKAKSVPKTIAEVYNHLNELVKNKGKRFGIETGGEAIVAPPPKDAKSNATTGQTGLGVEGGQGGAVPPVAAAKDAKGDAKPALAGAAPVATSNTPFGNLPVATTAPTAAAATTAVSTPPVNAPVAPTKAPLPQQAQTTYQTRDNSPDALGIVNTTLNDSLKVEQQQLDLLGKIYEMLAKQSMPKKEVPQAPQGNQRQPQTIQEQISQAPAPEVSSTITNAAIRAPQEARKAAVSMAKPDFR